MVLREYLPRRAVDRRFWTLVGLSVLLHGALFAGIAWQRKPLPEALPPLLASIRLLAAPHSEPVRAAAPVAQPAVAFPQKARQPVAVAERRSSPHVVKAAEPAKAPAQSTPSTATAEVASPAMAAPPALSAAAPAGNAESARQARPQADVLAAYRQHLTALFARGYEYPRIAALRGWEGEVRLRLKVARKGNLLGISLDRSSGFDVLDQHAQAMLAGYGDLPPQIGRASCRERVS
jgi:protein TonB